MTRHFDYCPSASEGDNQSVRSSAPVVSRCFPGGYNVKLYISRGRLAWWLLAFLHTVGTPTDEVFFITNAMCLCHTLRTLVHPASIARAYPGNTSVRGHILSVKGVWTTDDDLKALLMAIHPIHLLQHNQSSVHQFTNSVNQNNLLWHTCSFVHMIIMIQTKFHSFHLKNPISNHLSLHSSCNVNFTELTTEMLL